MKPFEKYLNNSPLLRDLLEIYLELRQHLQEMGFSESELDNPPTYTFKMMRLQDRFQDQFNYLIRFMLDYGFDVTKDEIQDYVMPQLLRDGDTERRDKGDEDSQ